MSKIKLICIKIMILFKIIKTILKKLMIIIKEKLSKNGWDQKLNKQLSKTDSKPGTEKN